MATRDEELARFVRQWAWLPIGDDARREVSGALRERVHESAELLTVDRELLTQLFDGSGEAMAAPDDDDLGLMLTLLVRAQQEVSDAGTDAHATLDRLSELATSSPRLAEHGLSIPVLSQVHAWQVVQGGVTLSEEQLSTIHKLLEVNAGEAAPSAYATAFGALSTAVREAGRSDIWQELVARFTEGASPHVGGEVSLCIAQFSRDIIERDSRAFRARQTLEQSLKLLEVARQQGATARLTDSIAVDLGLAYVHNRDLDERPLIDDLDETVTLLAPTLAQNSRGELAARFADLAARLREDPRVVREAMSRWWIDWGADAQDPEANWAMDTMLRELEIRDDDVAAIRARYEGFSGDGGGTGHAGSRGEIEELIVHVATSGESEEWIPLLEEWGSAARSADEKLATELAVLAVRVRSGADLDAIAAQFEELGGIGALDSPEAPVVQRLRYIVSQEIDAWNAGVLPAASDRVAGVPEGLYSADPEDRYEALQWIRSSWAFLAAEQNDDETWERAYPILAEGYTRGIADPDERVRERSVILARRIILWHYSRSHDEVVRWAQRVVADTDALTSPRAVRARCMALYDIEQYSDVAGVASAAAARLDRELEGSLADYAFVIRALSFRWRIDNSQALEKLVPLFERCIELEIEAEHHDEYEQQDWNDRLRQYAMWLFKEHQARGRWEDAVRNAELLVSRLSNTAGPDVDEFLSVRIMQDLASQRKRLKSALGARADAVIREAAEWLGEDVQAAQARAQSRSKASPPRWIAGAILVLGVLLAVAAAFAVAVAPDGASVAVNGRRGGVQFEADLWVLFIPAVAALAVGLVARSRPEMLGVPARRTAVAITVALLATVVGVFLIMEALG